MTELLERAIALIRTLPTQEQNAIASMILEEIEDELRWEQQFSRSPDVLAQLTSTAIAEYHAGDTKELNPENL